MIEELSTIILDFAFEPVHEISKPQISLRIRAVWSEPLLAARVIYDC